VGLLIPDSHSFVYAKLSRKTLYQLPIAEQQQVTGMIVFIVLPNHFEYKLSGVLPSLLAFFTKRAFG